MTLCKHLFFLIQIKKEYLTKIRNASTESSFIFKFSFLRICRRKMQSSLSRFEYVCVDFVLKSSSLSDDEDNDQTNSQQKIVANEHQKSTTDQSNFDAENFIKTDRIKFVNEIIPKDCLSFVRCHVERRRQGLSTMFSLFFDGQNEQNAVSLFFLSKQKSSSFIFFRRHFC